MSTRPTLTYFPLNGRAFAIRAALRHAKFDYVDERVSFPEFASKFKPDSKRAPFGSLPVLQVPGVGVFTQSLALAKWAARKSDLYPKQDEFLALRCDELLLAMDEVLNKIPHVEDAGKREKSRAHFCAQVLPKYYSYFQAQIETSGGPYLLGKELSVADLVFYSQIELLESGMFDYIDTKLVAKEWPKLYAYYRALKQHPIVAAELKGNKAKL